MVQKSCESAQSQLALIQPRSLSCSVWVPRVRSCSLKCKALLRVAEGRNDSLPPDPEKRDELLPFTIPIPVPVSMPEMLIFTANLLYVFGQNFIFSREREFKFLDVCM